MGIQLPKAPNARDYALAAWESASTTVQEWFLGRRGYLGNKDKESMRQAFERYLDAELADTTEERI